MISFRSTLDVIFWNLWSTLCANLTHRLGWRSSKPLTSTVRFSNLAGGGNFVHRSMSNYTKGTPSTRSWPVPCGSYTQPVISWRLRERCRNPRDDTVFEVGDPLVISSLSPSVIVYLVLGLHIFRLGYTIGCAYLHAIHILMNNLLPLRTWIDCT